MVPKLKDSDDFSLVWQIAVFELGHSYRVDEGDKGLQTDKWYLLFDSPGRVSKAIHSWFEAIKRVKSYDTPVFLFSISQDVLGCIQTFLVRTLKWNTSSSEGVLDSAFSMYLISGSGFPDSLQEKSKITCCFFPPYFKVSTLDSSSKEVTMSYLFLGKIVLLIPPCVSTSHKGDEHVKFFTFPQMLSWKCLFSVVKYIY